MKRMSGRPEINGRKACVHGRFYDVCKEKQCRDMYQKWLLDQEFEEWKQANAGNGDAIDAMIFLLRNKKKGMGVEMRDEISTLVARVRRL